MSEFTNDKEKRVEDLLSFSRGIMSGENGKDLIERYNDAINSLTPHDMLPLEERQLRMGTILKDTFLYYLMLENEKISSKLQQIRIILKSYRGVAVADFSRMKIEFLQKITGLGVI